MATFFVNAFVRRVNRRIDIRIVRFWRSTSKGPIVTAGVPAVYSALARWQRGLAWASLPLSSGLA